MSAWPYDRRGKKLRGQQGAGLPDAPGACCRGVYPTDRGAASLTSVSPGASVAPASSRSRSEWSMVMTDPCVGPGLDRATQQSAAAETRRVLPQHVEEARHVLQPSHLVRRQCDLSTDTNGLSLRQNCASVRSARTLARARGRRHFPAGRQGADPDVGSSPPGPENGSVDRTRTRRLRYSERQDRPTW